MLPPPAGSPFLGPKGKPVAVERAAFIDVTAPAGARMMVLAVRAARTAVGDLLERTGARLGLLLVTDKARPGLSDVDVRMVEEALTRLLGPVFVEHVRGQAGPFGAIHAMSERARRERAEGVLVLAVDSFISTEYLAHYVTRGPSHWMTWPPSPSEGAAAMLVTDPTGAARWKAPVEGWLGAAAAQSGASHDDNDDVVDGVALTDLVRRVTGPTVHYVFGQGACGNLRTREWLLAMGRTAERFRGGHDEVDLESMTGSLGVAAGLANGVFGLAALRHRTLDFTWPRQRPFLAWHITRDGMRGAASFRAEIAP
jgi:hypothetical protein